MSKLGWGARFDFIWSGAMFYCAYLYNDWWSLFFIVSGMWTLFQYIETIREAHK